MYLINRHLLTATAGPFLFGWFVITFLLMIDVLFRYVDLFVSKGVPFLLATRVLGLSLGHTFALSVPMAVLVGVLMGVGQLAADHEITAMRASGLSLWSLARSLFVAAAVIAVLQTAYNHYIYPRSNHMLVNLLQDIGRQKPMLEIREQQFTDLNEHLTIFVSRKDDRTGAIDDVTIIEKAQPGDASPRLTIAVRGRIVPDHANDLLRLELEDGEIHEVPDPARPGHLPADAVPPAQSGDREHGAGLPDLRALGTWRQGNGPDRAARRGARGARAPGRRARPRARPCRCGRRRPVARDHSGRTGGNRWTRASRRRSPWSSASKAGSARRARRSNGRWSRTATRPG